jgi:hypothetical protein
MLGDQREKAEVALRTYVSALMYILTQEERLRLEAQAKKGETAPNG